MILSSDVTATGTGSFADVKFFDAVVVQGTKQVKSSNGGVLFYQSMTTGAGGVNGDTDTVADHLTVLAAQSVMFKEVVGGSNPLESLTIGAASAKVTDVTFEKSVVIDGDLTIYATGNVNFNAGVRINHGGSLRIFGANQVAFSGGEVVLNPSNLGSSTSPAGDSGDLFLEANSLQFPALDDSVRATGMGAALTIRPTDPARPISLLSPQAAMGEAGLDLSTLLMEKVATSTFSKIVVGHEVAGHATGTSHLRVGAVNTPNMFSVMTALELYGGQITFEDYSNPNYFLSVDSTLKADAVGSVFLRNTLRSTKSIEINSASSGIYQQNTSPDFDQLLNERIEAPILKLKASAIYAPWAQVGAIPPRQNCCRLDRNR